MRLNSISEFKEFIKKFTNKKIFLITGHNSYRLSTAKNKFDKLFKNLNIFFYYKKNNFPEIEELKKIISSISQFQPDLILAIGGGAVMDYSKIASCYSETKNLKKELISGRQNLKKKFYLAVVPTTAGSGAEVTSNAVMYIKNNKYSFEGNELIPNTYFLIPELIIKNNKKIKASSGFDAISQALESLISNKSSNKSIKYAINSLDICLENYINYLQRPNKNNSSLMLYGSMLAGQAINISKTTAPHAISYPFTSIYKISHGHAVSLTLEKFLKFNYYNKNKAICDFDLNQRYNLIFKVFKVKNIIELENKIKNIKKLANLEDNFKKLKININNDYYKILSGVNLLRLKNNPIKLEKKDLKIILLNKSL